MDWVHELAAWAWERHHNVLSWYIRPLFLLPFCFFAYRRSVLGIVLTLVALATSMAWFPAPGAPSSAVIFKIAWTYAVSGTAGADAQLVPALAGLVVVNALVIMAGRLLARRRTKVRLA